MCDDDVQHTTCVTMMCILYAWHWCAYYMRDIDVHTTCVTMMCLLYAWRWCAFYMRDDDVHTICVAMMCILHAWRWCAYYMRDDDVHTICVTMMCTLYAWQWCAAHYMYGGECTCAAYYKYEDDVHTTCVMMMSTLHVWQWCAGDEAIHKQQVYDVNVQGTQVLLSVCLFPWCLCARRTAHKYSCVCVFLLDANVHDTQASFCVS